jgi:hypothetical protein
MLVLGVALAHISGEMSPASCGSSGGVTAGLSGTPPFLDCGFLKGLDRSAAGTMYFESAMIVLKSAPIRWVSSLVSSSSEVACDHANPFP